MLYEDKLHCQFCTVDNCTFSTIIVNYDCRLRIRLATEVRYGIVLILTRSHIYAVKATSKSYLLVFTILYNQPWASHKW